MLSENLPGFMQDFSVPCLAGVYAFAGIPGMPDEILNMGGVNVTSTMYTLLVQTSDVVAGAIKSGSVLTVNGQPFTVRDVLSQDDGAFSNLTLSK